MKCKKHFTDLSSVVGVCASCLRERLFVVIEAQTKLELPLNATSKQPPTNLVIPPRSVSPYIGKSGNDAVWNNLSEQRFYSTPQVDMCGKKPGKKFSLLTIFFLSTPKVDKFDSDIKSRCSAATTTTEFRSSSSSPWFANIFSGKRNKKPKICSVSDNTSTGRVAQRQCRGLSPAVESDDEEGSSGCTTEFSPPPRWKETPGRSSAPAVRGKRMNHGRTGSGLVFCLSPLVRASPSRQWNKGSNTMTDMVGPGEVRVPVKPHLGVAAAYCANRSRKIANFGRYPKY